jgi:hypothetical protein
MILRMDAIVPKEFENPKMLFYKLANILYGSNICGVMC